QKESQKADEYLREIKEQKLLPEAVSQCIEAAGYEHEPETQKSLLRAASFGKCFIDKFPPESFVRMCQDLRVLNAIRDYQIGIPLTFTQYKRLTIEVLLDRLVLRRLYPLAIRICEYLRLSEIQGVSRILAHWACYKVQQKDKSDEEVAHAINQKLGDTPGISYSEIAARAYDCGRTELAIKLLEYEPRSGEQVPLLLKMKRSKLALSKAIESGDTDLVYTVVLHLKNELNRGTFFMTLQNQPVALSLYRQFCKHQERETLKDLYNQDDNHQELGNFHVHSSYA
ncbi:VPS16 protein, partial [Nothocercus julius]|nr:VPS16 protein [Nothocercus julius]